MALFDSILILVFLAIAVMPLSRRFRIPYPTLLALAGACVAAFPWVPDIGMDPHLALALFVSPALLDAAYDLPPRQLRRDCVALVALAFFAVVVTTAVVAVAGWAWGRLPLLAAVTLGAIVAPPDAAAAAAVLKRFELPRQTLSILHGESLLNDAVALLIFSGAVAVVTAGGAPSALLPRLLVAAPGGLALGFVLGLGYLAAAPRVAGTLSCTVLELLATFGTWVLAERAHLSPILAMVAFGMTVARHASASQTARDRVHSYAVWDATVFVLNVVAFLLMGLQARTVLGRLAGTDLSHALWFAAGTLVLVIGVRMVWVLGWGALIRRLRPRDVSAPTVRQDILVGWCGMRGLVTVATAFALPAAFPGRDLIVLSAFTVVLGTLLIQGLSIGALLRLLRISPDRSLELEVSAARTTLFEAAVAGLADRDDPAAASVRAEYEAAREVARDPQHPQGCTEHQRIRMSTIAAQRLLLVQLRREAQIADDTFHRLQEELDWAELHAAPHGHFQMADT